MKMILLDFSLRKSSFDGFNSQGVSMWNLIDPLHRSDRCGVGKALAIKGASSRKVSS